MADTSVQVPPLSMSLLSMGRNGPGGTVWDSMLAPIGMWEGCVSEHVHLEMTVYMRLFLDVVFRELCVALWLYYVRA